MARHRNNARPTLDELLRIDPFAAFAGGADPLAAFVDEHEPKGR